MTDWLKVEGFPDYSVNPLGQVRRDDTERLVTVRVNQDGLAYVGLMRNAEQINRSLPKLVASVFVPKPSEVFITPICMDGDRLNCAADNLAWRPRWYAVKYVNQFEERYESPIDSPVRAVDESVVFPDSLSAAASYGLLEEEVVMSVLNNIYTWPTYQQFELAEKAY